MITCMSDDCTNLCSPFEVGIGVLSAVNAWQEVTGFKLVWIKAYSRSVDWLLIVRLWEEFVCKPKSAVQKWTTELSNGFWNEACVHRKTRKVDLAILHCSLCGDKKDVLYAGRQPRKRGRKQWLYKRESGMGFKRLWHFTCTDFNHNRYANLAAAIVV